MSDEIHMVTLPDGKERGPFSAEVLQDLLQSGGLPHDATVTVGDEIFPLATGLELLLTRPRRASPQVRAEQGGTQAETPQAISRAAKRRTATDE